MTTIKIGGVHEHFNYPWHLTQKNGGFSAKNINIDWEDYHGGTGALVEALEQKEIDIALMLTEGIVKKIVEGSPLKIIQNYIASPLIWGIHVAKNSSYQTVEELENTKAAISRYGSGSHLLTYLNAKNHGWDTKNLKFEIVKNLSGAIDALPADEAQYFMWEHFTTKPLVDKGIFRRVGDFPTPWPCFVIVAHEDYLKTHENEVQAMLQALNKTTVGFKKIPAIEEKIALKYEQKEEDVKAWLKLTEWGQQQISEEAIDTTQQHLKMLQLIEKTIPYKEFIHSF